MKEEYYTNDSIGRQAKKFLEKIFSFHGFHDCSLNSQEIALLIVDCQKFFFDESSHAFVPSSKAILPEIVKLQEYCLQNGIKVIKTKHINNKENSKMMGKWWGDDLIMEEDPLSDFVSEIVLPEDIVINKSQYDAFYETDLDSILKSFGIKQLIIAGVMTHLCCETTARAAFTRGYEVFFCVDGTATYNREFHLASLLNLAHGFAMPLLVEEIINELQKK